VNSANKLASSGDPYTPGDLGSIGIGWAIPIDVIKPVLDQLRAGEDPTHAWLGIVPGNATDVGVPQGALVKELEPGSAAAEAGVEQGDIVVALETWKIQERLGLITTTLAYRPGDEVTLTVLRGGEEQEIEVTLGEKGPLFE
jgi:putative serine protease PepD